MKILKSLNVRIPNDMQRQLKMISKKERVPLSDLVRESLRQYLIIKQFRQLRNTALPFAEAQGILTDEDVFKSVS